MTKKLRIQSPCSENFFEMEDSEVGKFCDQCAKNVVDIRGEKSFEINLDTGTCIFAEKKQLQTPFLLKRLASGAIIATSTLALTACNDTPKSIIKTEISSTQPKEDVFIMEGKVVSGLLNLTAMDSATVKFVRVDAVISTTTDENGKFKLEIPTRLVEDKNLILIQRSDYKTEQKLISKNELLQPLKISLEEIEKQYFPIMETGEIAIDIDDNSIAETYIDGERKTEKELEQIFDIDTIDIKQHLFFSGEFAQHLAKKDSIEEVSIILTK